MSLQLGRDIKELEQYCEDIKEIEKGIDFILSHLEEPLIFPRKISTQKSQNKQFSIRDKQDIINSFVDSKLVDCRINAFPILKEGATWIPNLLFIDLDLADFNFNKRSLKLALNKTLKNIKEKLNGDDGDDNYDEKNVTANPTVLWSGNGYHILLPVCCPIALEHIQQFQGFTYTSNKPSEAFLRFAKDYLSNYKADKGNNPSFRSCLLRIPYSLNSKCLARGENFENSKIKIIQQWNGYRPPLKELLYDFRRYLIQKKINTYNYRQKTLWNAQRRIRSNKIGYNNIYYYYEWIETKILQNPFEDCRKIIVNLILAPYLINIKKLSYLQTYHILKDWLDKCHSLHKLDNIRNFESQISYAIKTAENKGIGPMSQEKIKIDSNYKRLYLLIKQKGRYLIRK